MQITLYVFLLNPYNITHSGTVLCINLDTANELAGSLYQPSASKLVKGVLEKKKEKEASIPQLSQKASVSSNF